MRKPFVAGNWKMFKTVSEARHLVSELVPGLQAVGSVDKVLCPPFTTLLAVAALLEGVDIGLGAQNMHWELSGAYTGEISPTMVAELCRYVIVGHSERRTYFGETDETVNKKVQAALAHGLTPIVCVGETLEENETARTAEVVTRQVRLGLSGIATTIETAGANAFVIAYEPVWAIGTGRNATPRDAAEVHAGIRRALMGLGAGVTRILYGGSVNAGNVAALLAEREIDGVLVGGASLDPVGWAGICSVTRER